jgi:hypothetical protein
MLRAGRSGVRISSPNRPDRLRVPSSLPFNGYRFSFPGINRPGRDADHSPLSSTDVKNEWSCTCNPPTRLHGMGREIFFIVVAKIISTVASTHLLAKCPYYRCVCGVHTRHYVIGSIATRTEAEMEFRIACRKHRACRGFRGTGSSMAACVSKSNGTRLRIFRLGRRKGFCLLCYLEEGYKIQDCLSRLCLYCCRFVPLFMIKIKNGQHTVIFVHSGMGTE